MKQLLCVVLSLLILVGGTATVLGCIDWPPPLPEGYMTGDPTGDGQINADDALFVLQQCVGKGYQNTANQISYEDSPPQILCCDTAVDGYLDAYDALLILQYAVGKIDRFPILRK